MSAHTPGPWHLAVAEDCAPLIIKPGVHDICEMLGAASNVGVMADARLIAAAPDLLAVARMAADNYYAGGGDEQTVARAARAAIAKAEIV